MTLSLHKENRTLPTQFGGHDAGFLFAIIALLSIGVVMVYSASIYVAGADPNIGDGEFYLRRQSINVAIGLVALILGMSLNYRQMRKWVYPLLLLSILSLALLLVPGLGTTVGRSTRWFRFPFFSFQPSEAAKFAFIAWMAYSLEKKNQKMQSFSIGFLPHILVVGVIMTLCLAQPDLGTCVVLAGVMVSLLFVAGTRVSYILALFFTAVPILVKLIANNSMRMRRILSFRDPWEHRQDVGYQAVNSLVAFGSGGVQGMGLGASRQKFGYLPEVQTDFIFPIIGEELGLIGVTVVLGLLIYVVCRGMAISWNAKDEFGRYLAFGIAMLFGLQAIINIGVALSLLPTKGLTLPFVSFGGSSLLVNCFAAGVLLNISLSGEPDGSEAMSEPAPRKPSKRRRPVTQDLSPRSGALG